MLSDSDINLLVTRLNFFENCIDQLREKIPIYVGKQSAISSGSQVLAKALRNVASSEPDRRIQNALFLFASKHELLDRERCQYRDCEEQILRILDDARKFQVSPLKAIIEESPQMRKQASMRQSDPSLPIHRHLFEIHRCRSLKRVIRKLLATEISYHARVIEELSVVLSAVDSIET